MMNSGSGSTCAPDELSERVRGLVEKHGVVGASRLLGLAPDTITRLVARLGVRHGTLLVVREGLQRLEANGS